MIDKQIIIDGVDVSGCECSSQIDLDINIICNSNSPKKCSGYCKDNPNCYYKQLKRKEQELQQAMDNYVQLDLQRVKEYNELVDLYKAKEQECEELKKTLTEIKETAKNNRMTKIKGEYFALISTINRMLIVFSLFFPKEK